MALIQKLEPLAKQRLFAVIHMYGKQSIVSQGDLLIIDHHLPLTCGQKLLLNKCLVLGGKDFSIIGRPVLDKELFRIEATVIEKTMSDHRVQFRHIPRNHGIRKFLYYALPRTTLRINEIILHKMPEPDEDNKD